MGTVSSQFLPVCGATALIAPNISALQEHKAMFFRDRREIMQRATEHQTSYVR
jgi:hypothetical protein